MALLVVRVAVVVRVLVVVVVAVVRLHAQAALPRRMGGAQGSKEAPLVERSPGRIWDGLIALARERA